MISRRRVLAALACLGLLAPLAHGEPPLVPLDLDRGAIGLALALRKLGVTGRVLYVTAHPDDEHNGVLVRLSRGLGLRTALLSLTRGEGGQNLIGPELFDALGVLRTEELMALHRYDGAEQFFGRAYEFGYSFDVSETLAKWGREETLRDVVRVVRGFRPDVILTLPLEGRGGGRHHQAVAQLARDAFRAAADPDRFPDQVREGLRPWQTRKIYQGGVGGSGEAPPGTSVRVPTGVHDPFLGQTWQQLGSRARAMHRCQGARQLVSEPDPAEGVYSLVDAEPAVAAGERDLLDGIDTSLPGLARLAQGSSWLKASLATLQAKAVAARHAFDPEAPEAAVPALAEALAALRAVGRELGARLEEPAARVEIGDRLADEEKDTEAALALAHGLVLEARADDGLVTPGQALGVALSLANGSGRSLDVEAVALDVPAGWTAASPGAAAGSVGAGEVRRWRFAVTVAAAARPSQPFWRRGRDRDRHELVVPADEARPWSPPAVVARVRCRAAGVETTLRAPAVWRYEGTAVGGERRHELQVVPELSIRLAPEIAAFPLGGPRAPLEVRAFVRSFARENADASLRLEVPAGWSVEPSLEPLRLASEGEEVGVRFSVRPPASLAPGKVSLRAVARREGREYRETLQEVSYDHIQRRQMLRPAETHVLALDVRASPAASVGYVMGSGDALADAIRQLGLPVALLGAEDLAFGELARFSTIVTGIRAYETRDDLRSLHGRLLRWVEAGGHLVVQYNRAAFNRVGAEGIPEGAAEARSPFAPYPALVTSERISDETAPLRALAPSHPLLTTPNRIGEGDWDGWVQERGIQFLAARDPRYLDLLAATDPFPDNPGEKRGMLVEAKVGRGTWTYVGLALFRQVPAGVPGGWRLLANLVSRERGR